MITELRQWLEETPKTGPGNKGRRKRLADAIRYLDTRSDKMAYGTYRKLDLEVGMVRSRAPSSTSSRSAATTAACAGSASALKRSSSCGAST